MKAIQLKFLIAFLNFSNVVFTIPNLSARSCDSDVCPLDWVDDALWGLYGGAGWVFNAVTGLLEPAPSPQTPSTPNQQQAPPSADPAVELWVVGPADTENTCEGPSATSPDIDSNQKSTNLKPCEKALQYIVWAQDCQQTSHNIVVGSTIHSMDSNLLTATDYLCPTTDGISYWVAKLTPEQADVIRKQAEVVKAVERDAKYVSDGFEVPSAAAGMQKRMRARLAKRATLQVIKETTQDLSLSFISTPRGQKNRGTYTYLQSTGQGIRIYLIGSGFYSGGLDEFVGQDVKWIFAAGTSLSEIDESRKRVGTCAASKILGRNFGVMKGREVELTIVKITPEISSFLDALGKIIEKLQRSLGAKQPVGGYAIVCIHYGWKENPSTEGLDTNTALGNQMEAAITASKMERLISELVRMNVVIVTASGQDERTDFPDSIDMLPAKFASNHDIITVGAVYATDDPDTNGRRYGWSHGGENVVVSAPGSGMCVSSDDPSGFQVADGTGISAAVVTGLVAYYLSLPDLGNHLRGFANIPQAVIQYLDYKSYPRFGAVESIWNGLDPQSTKTEWQYWLGLRNDYV